MSEHRRIRDFNRELDAALADGGADRDLPLDPSDRERLALGKELRDLDVAGESLVREGLRRHLMGRHLPHPWRRSPSPTHRRNIMNMMRKPVISAGLAAVVAVAALAIFSPGTLSALTRPIVAVIKRVTVGPKTEIIQVEDIGQQDVETIMAEFDRALAAGETWFLQTPYGGGGGPVPEGEEPYTRHYASLVPADKACDLDLLVPTVWPEQYPERLHFQRAWINPDGSAQLVFLGGPLEFVLTQTPIPEGGGMFYGSGEVSTDDPGLRSIMPNTRQLEWDGQKLVWSDRPEGRDKHLQFARERKEDDPPCGSLMWEKDGVSYVLDGQNMTLEWAEKLYRSLKKAKDL